MVHPKTTLRHRMSGYKPESFTGLAFSTKHPFQIFAKGGISHRLVEIPNATFDDETQVFPVKRILRFLDLYGADSEAELLPVIKMMQEMRKARSGDEAVAQRIRNSYEVVGRHLWDSARLCGIRLAAESADSMSVATDERTA